MKQSAIDNREKISDIKRRFKAGEIDYYQAKAEAEPVLKEINAKAVEIAKKYGKKPRTINFSGII